MGTDDEPRRTMPRWRRWARRIALSTLVGVLAVVLLAAVVLGLVASPPGRERVCAFAESRVSEALRGEISIGRCARLTPWRLRLEEVVVRGEDGRSVASVGAVDVEVKLLALLEGTIQADSLAIERPRVSLAETDTGLALVEALSPVPSEEAQPDEVGDSDPLTIVFNGVSIDGGEVTDLPDGLSIGDVSLRAGGSFDGNLGVAVESLTADLRRGDDQRVVRLTSLSGAVFLRPGITSHLEAELESGEDRLGVDASMRWGEAGPRELRGNASFSLSPQLLERLGQAEAARAVTTRLSGNIRLEGAPEDLRFDGRFGTDGGHVVVEGRLADDRLEASLQTPGLDLSRVAAGGPEEEISLRLSASMDDVSGAGEERALGLRVEDLRFGERVLPLLEASGALEPDAARLDSLALPHLTAEDGRLDVNARVGFDGAAEVTLDALLPDVSRDGNLRELLPGAGGSVEATVRARLSAGESRQLSAEGRVLVSGLVAPDLRLARGELRGSARGEPSAPVLSLRATASGLHAGGVSVRETAVSARGGPERYDVDGRAVLDDGRSGELDLVVRRLGPAWGVDGVVVARGVWDGPLRLALAETRVDPSSHVSLGRTRATGRGLDAGVEGTYRFEGSSSLRATVAELDLATLDRALELGRGLRGRTAGEATLSGTPSRPEVRARLSVDRGGVDAVDFPTVAVEAGYSSRARQASFDARVDLGAQGSLALEAEGALRRSRSVVESLRRGEWEATTEIVELDLAAVDEILRLERGLRGRATARVELSGSPERPDVRARLLLAEVRVDTLSLPRATVALRHDSLSGEAEVDAEADLGEYGRASLEARGELESELELVDALQAGPWQIEAELEDVPLSIVELVAPSSPELAGVVQGRLHARGNLAEPVLEVDLAGRGLAAPEMRPVDVDLSASLESDLARVQLDSRDESGPLASLSARAIILVDELLEGADPRSILERPWTVTASAPWRDVSDLPVDVPARPGLPDAVTVDVELAGGEAAPTRGDVAVTARWRAALPGMSETCRQQPPPDVQLAVALRDGESRVRVEAALPEGETVEAMATVATPVDDWVRDGLPEELLSTLTVAGSVRLDLPLEAVPYACRRAAGRVVAVVDAEGLLSAEPRLDLSGEVRQLRVVGGPEAADLSLTASVAPGEASASARMSFDGREAMALRGSLPVSWAEGDVVPELVDEPWTAQLRFDQAPVAPLLAGVPNVARPTGIVDGSLDIDGRGREVTALGQLSFDGLGMTIREPFQRIDDLEGTLRIADGAILFSGIELRDLDGLVQLDGEVRLDEWTPTGLELRLRTRRFPLRSEGVIFARATSRLTVEADLQANPRTARIVVEDTSVEIPDETGRVVQRLDQHPDVIYEGQPGFDAAAGSAAAGVELEGGRAAVAGEGDAPATPLVVTIDASDPFWVRRADFAMQLTAELRARVEDGSARLSGRLQVRRGFLTLLGKSFDFEPGELVFAGGSTVDPLLDLTAVHTLRSDDTVTVHIGGRLSDPDITFSTTVPGATTEREILALLVTGRRPDAAATAEQEALSMLATLTAGLLSTLARRQLGGIVPVLAIESHGTSDTRVRAGIQADRLIPRWLRGVIEGVYVEGFVGTEQEGEESDTGVTGGAAIELYFPYDLVTTGTYEEPDNWSVDLTWEP